MVRRLIRMAGNRMRTGRMFRRGGRPDGRNFPLRRLIWTVVLVAAAVTVLGMLAHFLGYEPLRPYPVEPVRS